MFNTAKGAYDIYILFIEKGLELLRNNGVLTFINPNKYLSAKYAESLREYILANASLIRLLDVSSIDIFEEAAVYPIVSILQKGSTASDRLCLCLPRNRENKVFDLGFFIKFQVSSDVLSILPENIWGFLLSPNIKLLIKLLEGTCKLSEIAAINASSTAGEADQYGSYIQNKTSNDSLKIINTGTIDRFNNLWGKKKLSHAGKKYLTPYLPLSKASVSKRRRELYNSPKLIYAKMAKQCETFYDQSGCFASINTNCLHSVKDGISLDFIVGYCNSKLFMFFYDQFFGSLRMSGGYYQFQSPQLRIIPFKKPNNKIDQQIASLVEKIMKEKSINIEVDTTALENEINQLIYKFYDLTPEEIKIVEGESENAN